MEISLTDFGIAGKILRLHNFVDAKPIIDDEIKRGAKTFVVVGNDRTLGHVLSRAATAGCTFGFIPIGSFTSIAGVLGIPVGLEACTILSRRRKECLDVGWVNNRFFISQLHIHPSRIEIIYDEKFRVTAKDKMELVICNLQPYFWKKDKKDLETRVVHPQDGKLEAFVRPLTKNRWWGYTYEDPSIFPFEEMEVRGEQPFPVEADGKITKEIRLKIKLAHTKVEMIVGRDRKF
ncbi:MAG: hypothetical protein A3I29_04235 [Candidatus Magasanikbacteria bacterium RIFCSPLOWO2_02_FULL_44_11]|uniref:DAGKc domain-containing protein n=1 Tax=Candidatus Magasanikbacteria bacterium RIFCSPLOWO2_02_FULL_44_11 TaxID=1798689 RepID=A0A1F6NA07_9BACT|nr:MAG: hypothetical protein A3I29_04235 [Candidatus Magasanikbacteria bacterium RIFCSPLOWO2_02_FULL_44_11]